MGVLKVASATNAAAPQHMQRRAPFGPKLSSRQHTVPGERAWGNVAMKKALPFTRKQRPIPPPKTAASGVEGVKSDVIRAAHENVTADRPPTDGQKILCEFVLQTLFNYLSCSAVAMATINAAGNGLLQTGFVMAAHAVIIPLVIFSGIEVSGAHFNPMVTACFVAVKKLPAKLGLGYVAAQLAGGVLGAFAAFRSLPGQFQTLAYAGTAAVPAGSTVQQAFFGEIIAAFAFVTILFGTNVHPKGWGQLKPFAIPLAVILLMWLVGPVSSLCINPARAFGPALVTGFWEHHWVWWTAPFIGGISAAKIYHSCFLPSSAR